MPGDLPDWYTQTQTAAVEADSLRNGLDADKSASPTVGQCYLARDTKKLYVCHTAGTWSCFDASILIQGILTLYANMVAGGYKLTGLGAPAAATDAARKTDVDTVDAKLDDITWSEPTRVAGTIYQNTGGKPRFVAITIATGPAGPYSANVKLGSSSPPTSVVAVASVCFGYCNEAMLPFQVPPNYYYLLTMDSGLNLSEWHEWDDH